MKKQTKIDDLNEPVLPRKRLQPNYSIRQFVSGHEEMSNAVEPYYPTTAKEHFKAIYFETIDAVHKALKERLSNQEHFKAIYFETIDAVHKALKERLSNQEHFKAIYFETIDAVHKALKERLTNQVL